MYTKSDFVFSVIRKKKRDTSGLDSLSIEHIMFSHPILVSHLMHLFNAMILFRFLPDSFGVRVIISLIKNSVVDAGYIYNYRGITRSPCISKLFDIIASAKTLYENVGLAVWFRRGFGMYSYPIHREGCSELLQ